MSEDEAPWFDNNAEIDSLADVKKLSFYITEELSVVSSVSSVSLVSEVSSTSLSYVEIALSLD